MIEKSVCWEEFRSLMPVSRRLAYFDHAAVAPIPGPARQAIELWAQQSSEMGDTVWPEWESCVTRVRQTAARLIGARPSEVALVPNTTAGINLVAEGFPWRPGDNVVTLDNEFPSNQYPWMNLVGRGVETRRVAVEEVAVNLHQIKDACDARTRILSVSWVGYATGWRIHVPELVDWAHQNNMLVLLDAIQGLGVFPIDVRSWGVDFLAADGHKWMLGPEGAGVFYIRQEHLPLLRPLNVGWNSVVHAHDFGCCELDLRPDASRYEGGSQNMVGMAGLGASLDLLSRFGLTPQRSPLADRVLELNRSIAEQLRAIGGSIKSSTDPAHASGILSFDLPGRDLHAVRRRCLDAGVVLSVRNNWLRVSPHAYINEDDIGRLVDVLSRA
jgi:selenocysteine lyase/cysteine desulfurase